MAKLHTVDLAIPFSVRDAVASLGDVCSIAIIAGGCLRDTYFGVPFNDIDIFVSPDFDGDALARKMADHWQVQVQWSEEASKTRAEEYQECFGIHMPAIWHMAELDSLGSPMRPETQIMVWPTMPVIADLLSGFDFGFSQIAHSHGTTYVTDAFLKDAADNTATFMLGADYQRLDRCRQRAERMAVRHPNRRWVWPVDLLPALDEEPF